MRPLRVVLPLLLGLTCWACASDDAAGHARRVPVGHDGAFETWWNDSQVRERGHYLGGLRHGQVTVYHPDGSLASVGVYEHGVPQGEVRHFAVGGALRLVETLHDGQLDGPRQEYDDAGRLRAVVPHRAGLRHGLEQRWFADGTLSTEGLWHDGLPEGRWRHWDTAGRLLSVEFFWHAGGQSVGYLETTYDPQGGQVTAQSLKTLHDGHWRGWRSFWHDNGMQAGLVEYRDDQRQGRDLSWDRQGRKSIEGQRQGDLRSGLWRTWDEHGVLLDESLYEQGHRVGPGGD